MNDDFLDLIRAWREKIRALSPKSHAQASSQCPSLGALQKKSPELSRHLKMCLYCQKRLAFLKNAQEVQEPHEDPSLDILAADAGVSLAEAVRYQPLPILLKGDGYETSHHCLAREDWQGHDTVYITVAVPESLRTFRDVSVAWKPLAKLTQTFQIYIAPDHATVVTRGKGHPGEATLKNIMITFHY